MHRLPNWRERLNDVMDKQRLMPFKWADNDCVLGFAFPIIEAIIGLDLALEYKGKYSTKKEAISFFKSLGYKNLGDAMLKHLPEIHPSRAQVGDIGLVKDPNSSFKMAFCMFDATGLIVKGEEGHNMLPREEAFRAFKVGQ